MDSQIPLHLCYPALGLPKRMSQKLYTFAIFLVHRMESDRAQADLGEAVVVELAADEQSKPKQPKKRYIGRKAASERAEQNGALMELSRTVEQFKVSMKSRAVLE